MNILKGTVGNNLAHVISLIVYLVGYYSISFSLNNVSFLNPIFKVFIALTIATFLTHIVFDFLEKAFHICSYNLKLRTYTFLIVITNITIFGGNYIDTTISVVVTLFVSLISGIPRSIELDERKELKELKEKETAKAKKESESQSINVTLKDDSFSFKSKTA